jgi:chromosome segregation ATPase
MAAPRRPTPVNDVDLEQTAELPVIDFTGTHAELLAGDATVNVRALSVDDPLSRTDTFNAPSLNAGAARLADNLRDVEDRLHRKSDRLAMLERDLAAARELAAEQLATARAEHERALQEALETAARREQELAAAIARHTEASERLDDVQGRLTQAERTLTAQEKELSQRARRLDELQGEFTQASGLARELGLERDGIAARVRALEESLGERTTALQSREIEVAQLGDSLRLREGDAARLLAERDDLRLRADSQLEALHRVEGYRGVADAMVGESAAELAERERELAEARLELAQLPLRDARIAELEHELATANARLQAHEQRIGVLTLEGQALQTRMGELNAALASADRGAQAQSEALRVAAEHSAEVESQLADERAATARLMEELTTAKRLHGEEVQKLRTGAASELEQQRANGAKALDELRSASAAAQTLLAERDAEITRLAEAQASQSASFAERERAIAERETAVTELLDDQQELVARLKSELLAANENAARFEGDLRAAEEQLRHLEAEHRHREARLEETTRGSEALQARLSTAERMLGEREDQVRHLEAEAHASAAVLGNLQQSIQRLSREDTGSMPAVGDAPLDSLARLMVRVDGDAEVVHVLGRRTTLGRTPDNDIRLDVNFVSRHHAVILTSPKHTIIEDLNSTNGVVVNGRRVTRQPLNDGDVVNIGTSEFRFELRPLGHPGDPA